MLTARPGARPTPGPTNHLEHEMTLTLLAALAVGYLVGRLRPARRLGRWADIRTRDDGRWWLDTPVVAAAFVATCPRGALSAWRNRYVTEEPQR